MVTYIDAATAPLRNTGQVRLYNDADFDAMNEACLLYTSPSPRDRQKSRMPSSA